MLHVGVCCAVVSVPYSLVVTCWERVDLLAVVCCVFLCFFSLSQMCPSQHQNKWWGWRRETSFWPFQGGASCVDFFFKIMFRACQAFLSVHCSSLVVTFWERAKLLALLCVMFYCNFVTFPCGVLGQLYRFLIFAFLLTFSKCTVLRIGTLTWGPISR